MNKPGILLVVSGPSGCGKGTVLGEVMDKDYYYSISATTRLPRKNEIDGINYKFLTKNEFEELVEQGGMLEHAQYCGEYYGTPKKKVFEMLEDGKNVVLEIEVQGAMQIKKSCPEAVFIFIAPPSISELNRRLHKRGTETEERIQKRLEQASRELEFIPQYDYLIINNELETAVEDFKAIVRAERLQKDCCIDIIKNLTEN